MRVFSALRTALTKTIRTTKKSPRGGGLCKRIADLAQQQHVLGRRGGRGLLGLAQLVDELDHQEDDEREDDEIDQHGDERAVAERRDARCLQILERFRIALERSRNLTEQHEFVREIQAARQHADHGHDEILHHRVDDLRKRSADDHADGEIHDVALDGEFLEFLDDAHGRLAPVENEMRRSATIRYGALMAIIITNPILYR